MLMLKKLSGSRLANRIATKQAKAALSTATSSSSSPTNVDVNPSKNLLGTASTDSFGQPTHATHPHLLNENELVPCITVEEFKSRRELLMTALQRVIANAKETTHLGKHNNMIIIPSAQKKYMSDKIPYPYRQNSDFFYMTGCLEPNSILMLTIDETQAMQSTLFVPPKDRQAEKWDGPRTGFRLAPEMFGVDEAYPIERFYEEFEKRYASGKPHIWYDALTSEHQAVTEHMRDIMPDNAPMYTPKQGLQSLRLYKSPGEQALMRKSCLIASEAINEVMQESRPGHSEHHLYAMVDYKCRMRNASHLAYPPVVAAGANGTIIHYIANNQLIKSGDLVLMDAGCEYGGYTSDITRTWPVDGNFREPQKVLYDVLLTLQKDMLQLLLSRDNITLDMLFDVMCRKLGQYLQEVGLVPKSITSDIGYSKAGYMFCPHHASHYLGMDVHDTPLILRNLPVQPGMAFTVEPGIYIGHERIDVPAEFRGLGLRIEDDVLINSDNQVEVLTHRCLKERHDLENLFKEKAVAL